MQLELAFLEQPVVPDEGPKGPWDQIDPQAQIAALVLLSRLIAQKLVAKSARESGSVSVRASPIWSSAVGLRYRLPLAGRVVDAVCGLWLGGRFGAV